MRPFLFVSVVAMSLCLQTIAGKEPMWRRFYIKGVIEFNDGLDPEAMYDLNRAVTYRDRLPTAHKYLGILYERRFNLEKAVRHYQKSLRYRPNQFDAMYHLGRIFEYRYELSQAEKLYHRILQREPRNVHVWKRIAVIMTNRGKPETARDIRLRVDKWVGSQARRYLEKARAQDRIHRRKTAMEWIRKALAVNPLCVDCYHFIADLYQRIGDVATAARILREVITFASDDPGTVAFLAHLLFEQKQLKESQHLFLNLCQNDLKNIQCQVLALQCMDRRNAQTEKHNFENWLQQRGSRIVGP